MLCNALAALIVTCLGYVPDTSKTVIMPQRCVKLLGKMADTAKTCARENGVRWRIVRKRNRK